MTSKDSSSTKRKRSLSLSGGTTVPREGKANSIFASVELFDEQDGNVNENDENVKVSTPKLLSSSKTNKKKGKKNLTHWDDEQNMQTFQYNDLQHHKEQQYHQALAVQAQTNLYSRLIECRILIQRSMTTAAAATAAKTDSTITEHDNIQDKTVVKDESEGTPTSTVTSNDTAVDLCNQILAKLLHARQLLDQTQERELEEHQQKGSMNNVGSDNDLRKNEGYYESLVANNDTEDELYDVLQEEYEQHHDYWKKVLNKRHYEIQLFSGKISSKKNSKQKQFTMIDTTFFGQVHSIVQHDILKQEQKQQPIDSAKYILFDDTKIYQQMLHDFVMYNQNNNNKNASTITNETIRKRKNSNTNGEQQRATIVDRKASKGRKIRYITIPKLTNFTFPVQRQQQNTSILTDEDVWFRSLFGSNI